MLMSGQGLVPEWNALVAADPTAAVVVDDAGSIDRATLDTRVELVAARLSAALGRAPRRPPVVAILAPHGSATVTAVLAVLRAGGSYLVLDPRWPSARIRTCCAAADPDALLAAPQFAAGLKLADLRAVVVELDASPGDGEVRDAPTTDRRPAAPVVEAGAAAYLSLTSGSTGAPKLVRQSHHGVRTCAANQRDLLHLTSADVLTLLTPFCYDMAAVDLWSALLSGAALAPYDLGVRGVAGLGDFLHRHGVTVFHSAPTVLRTLAATTSSSALASTAVRAVLLGGEPTVGRDVRLARDLFGGNVTVAAGYGSSEASFSTMLVLPPDADTEPDRQAHVLPVGTALPGFEITLDTTGEILVTGTAVALGYLDDPDGRFVDAGVAGRTFRTGDLGEWVDGRLYHRGRLDRQLTLRGIRVDPHEVEAVLLDLPGITGALVCLDPTSSGGPAGDALVALITVEAALPTSAAQVRQTLRGLLPAAMVPSRIEVVDDLAVGETGKRIRPATSAVAGPRIADPAATSGRPTVEKVRAIVSDVLAIPVADLDEGRPLLDSGAHSLDLVRIHAALSGEHQIELVDLFDLGTIRAIATHLDVAGTAGTRAVSRPARAALRTARRPTPRGVR